MLAAPLWGAHKPDIILQSTGSSPACALAFAQHGRLLASMSLDGSGLQLWDVASGRELRRLDPGRTTGGTPSFVFIDGGARIESLSSGHIKVWDVETGREIESVALANITKDESILSPDGRWLASFEESAQGKTSIQIWNARSGQQMLTITAPTRLMGKPARSAKNLAVLIADQRRGLMAAAFSPDGSRLATWEPAYPNESSSTIRIWDIPTGREQISIAVPERTSQSSSVPLRDRTMAFSLDGGSLALLVRSESSTPAASQNASADSMRKFEKEMRKDSGAAIARAMSAAMSEGQAIESRVAVWDAASGRSLLTWGTTTTVPYGQLPEHLAAGRALAFSANHVLAGAVDDSTVKWFDVIAGQDRHAWEVSAGAVSLAVDAEDNLVAVGERNNSITLRDLQTGRVVRTLSGNVVPVVDIAFSSDGRRISAGGYGAVTLWDLATGINRRSIVMPESFGKQYLGYLQHNSYTQGGFFSADGSLLVAASLTDPLVKVWNVNSGEEVSSIALSPLKELQAGALSPDGKLLAVVEQLGESPEARAAQTQQSIDTAVALMRQSAKGSRHPAGNYPGALPQQAGIKLMDVATGREVRTLSNAANAIFLAGPRFRSPLAFSPDGKLLAAGSFEGVDNPQIQLWETVTGAQLPPLAANALRIAFSPDGRLLAAASVERASNQVNSTVHVWDILSRKEVVTVPIETNSIATELAYSPDGKSFTIAAVDERTGNTSILIWDTQPWREQRRISAPGVIRSLAFSLNGRLLASVGVDGSTRIWDPNNGDALAVLVSLNQGADWLVVTPEGLFDGSPAAWSQILWRFSESLFDVAPVEVFFNEFYYPGLLSEIAAGKRPKPTQDIAEKDRRQPRVELSLASPNSVVSTRTAQVRVTIAEAASGAQDVRLFRNGSLVKVWHGDVLQGQKTATLEADIPVIAGQNSLSAYAFNHANIKSLDATLTLRGAETLKRRGVVHILAIGIDAYSNSQYDLRYAVADARAMAAEVQAQQERLGIYERVEALTLFDGQATRAGILEALDHLAGTVQPEDAVIVYYAGHGIGYQSRFYLVPHDLGYEGERTALDAAGLETILRHGISDAELGIRFEKLDAAASIMIIDACNSGQALEAEEKRRGPMNSKGLAQLAYEKGMYILTAAQSYQAALEAAQLGHGYLTYTLIEEGLKKNAADFDPRDGRILAREWFDYAAMRVPEMQIDKMRSTRALVFVEGDEKIDDLNLRSLQRPRLFYRRELEEQPFVVSGRPERENQ